MKMNFTESILSATEMVMDNDKNSVLFGLGVNDDRGLQGTTKDLFLKFGENRVFDTPIAEDAMMGFAVGSALSGVRTIYNHARSDFLLLTFNQLFNVATKYKYMFNGAYSVPLIIRCLVGYGWGAQHSQVLSSVLSSFPGISVVCPSNPYDAKGLFIEASKHKSPVIFMEDFQLYSTSADVPEENYYVKFDEVEKVCEGDELTIVAISSAVLAVKEFLSNENNYSIDALLLKSSTDIDYDTIAKSIKKTKKLLFIQNSWMPHGLGANILRELQLRRISFTYDELGFPFTPTPYSPFLEKEYYINKKRIENKIKNLLIK